MFEPECPAALDVKAEEEEEEEEDEVVACDDGELIAEVPGLLVWKSSLVSPVVVSGVIVSPFGNPCARSFSRLLGSALDTNGRRHFGHELWCSSHGRIQDR